MPDDIDIDDLDLTDPELVKKLRNKIKAQDKELGATRASLAEFEKAARTTALADKVKDKGLNPSITALVPKDLDDAGIDAWLVAAVDVFGTGPASAAADETAAAEAAEAQRQAGLMDLAVTSDVGDAMARINAVDISKEGAAGVLAAMRSAA